MSSDATSGKRSTSHAPKVRADRPIEQPGRFAGWISQRWNVAWIVSDARKDKRTGAINPTPPEKKVYLLQYEVRDPGQHKAFARFQGIAAVDHIDAARQAIAYMDEIRLATDRRESAELFYNERKISLWIGQKENGASEK